MRVHARETRCANKIGSSNFLLTYAIFFVSDCKTEVYHINFLFLFVRKVLLSGIFQFIEFSGFSDLPKHEVFRFNVSMQDSFFVNAFKS